jgi:DNA-binding response OmpR family regulator
MMAQRLLLADDSITIQKVVELVLAEEDFEIRSVSNGEDALALVDTFRPDIVLADIEMPKMNGYQLCERIKQNAQSAGIPVILLAGAFEPIDEELAVNVGADDSIVKPFESQELISKINATLAMASAGVAAEAVSGESEAGVEAEAFELAGEEMGEEGEAVEVAGLDEDLWAMEEVASPEATAEEEVMEEAGLDTSFALAEEEISAPPAFAERAGTSVTMGVPETALPSKEEFLAVFGKTLNEKFPSMMGTVDIGEVLVSAITPVLKDAVEKILWEIAPDLVEKMLKEVLRESVSSLRGEVEKVIWETVPDLAGTMISKEIEKIKAEF